MSMNMENFDESLFEEDEFADESSSTSSQPNEPQESELAPSELNPSEEGDLTSDVLRLKGINNPDKIKFEDESGAVVERAWDSLSRDEQINILTQTDDPSTDLNNDEIALLNSIRSSGLSVSDYMNSISSSSQEQPKSYKVDALSDEDLYALDLLEKVGSDNISDEELSAAVALAKTNESLFKKTVEGLRNEYIRLQEDEEAQQANAAAEQQQAAYNQFASSIINEIRGLNSFAGRELELSNEDSEDLAAFMLDLDELGTSAFGRALLNPALFTRAAFWLLNENEIVEELTKLMLDTYKRGYAAALQDMNKPQVVFNPKPASKSKEDLMDDEDWL